MRVFAFDRQQVVPAAVILTKQVGRLLVHHFPKCWLVVKASEVEIRIRIVTGFEDDGKHAVYDMTAESRDQPVTHRTDAGVAFPCFRGGAQSSAVFVFSDRFRRDYAKQ